MRLVHRLRELLRPQAAPPERERPAKPQKSEAPPLPDGSDADFRGPRNQVF